MLWFSDNSSEYGQTDIRVGLCLLLTGCAFGGAFGELVVRIGRNPKTRRRVTAVAVLLLAGILGAIAGWLVGDVRANNRFEHRAITRQSALHGAAIGLIVGGVLAGQFVWASNGSRSPSSRPDG